LGRRTSTVIRARVAGDRRRALFASCIAVARYAGLLLVAKFTQGSRTHPGLHAIAHYVGSDIRPPISDL